MLIELVPDNLDAAELSGFVVIYETKNAEIVADLRLAEPVFESPSLRRMNQKGVAFAPDDSESEILEHPGGCSPVTAVVKVA